MEWGCRSCGRRTRQWQWSDLSGMGFAASRLTRIGVRMARGVQQLGIQIPMASFVMEWQCSLGLWVIPNWGGIADLGGLWLIKAVLVFVCDLQWARQENIDSFFVLNKWLIVWFQVLDGWVHSCGDWRFWWGWVQKLLANILVLSFGIDWIML